MKKFSAAIIFAAVAIIAGTAYALTSYVHVFGPYLGPTITTKGAWVTQNLPMNSGQDVNGIFLGQSINYQWQMSGCAWEPPYVCGLQTCAPELHCGKPTPADLQVKVCAGYGTNDSFYGCWDVSSVKIGWITGLNIGYTPGSAPLKLSFKFFLPTTSAAAGISGAMPGQANGQTMYGVH